MDTALQQKLLFAQTRSGRAASLTVSGVSMNPTLYEGDIVTIQKADEYTPGDILVFVYKSGELLIHRLLKKNMRYFCKGDNALRLEDVEAEQIAGKVILVNNIPPEPWPEWKIQLSLDVNRTFRACRYDIDKTKSSDVYRHYADAILAGKAEPSESLR